MRDTRVIAGASLIVATIILSTVFMIGAVERRNITEAPAPPAPPAASTQPVTPATNTTTPPTKPSYPTGLSEQLSSVTVSSPVKAVAAGFAMGVAEGNAYGIAKQALRLTSTMIADDITVYALQGTIPGTTDTISLQAYYNGNSVPYCSISTTFGATGLSTYTTTLMCKYLGAGTYTFKVTVTDENGTVIGDPTTTMAA